MKELLGFLHALHQSLQQLHANGLVPNLTLVTFDLPPTPGGSKPAEIMYREAGNVSTTDRSRRLKLYANRCRQCAMKPLRVIRFDTGKRIPGTTESLRPRRVLERGIGVEPSVQ
jgi:hypothetical protein